MKRRRIRVRGTVQGVGFRPFVYRIAGQTGVSGWVLNDQQGVLIEVQGPAASLSRFAELLAEQPPPLAVIDRLEFEEIKLAGDHGFEIRASIRGADSDAVIAPDTATCPDCLSELFDVADRRYRYPFTNCTNCGPRLTIIDAVPYDRANTTMAGFEMCGRCRAEYENPADRRFHAQPNACADCGPQLRLIGPAGTDGQATELPADAALAAAADLLVQGSIVAIKGLGGYHLACDARNQPAVAALRARKHREDKPFALMVGDVETAAMVVEVTGADAALLSGVQRPIVLMPALDPAVGGLVVAEPVAPGLRELGVMLAYTPLHHLLLREIEALTGRPAVLVMTSANASDEPIAFDDDDALARLDGIADAFLVHDRPIRSRVDDSVLRAGGQMLRRSRGYAPSPLTLPVPATLPLLAAGADLKNTFALARGHRVWVSHHIGDLENYAALSAYRDEIKHFERLFDVSPELIVDDLHPRYASRAYAQERADGEGIERLSVQHHHAHMAACMAEHGLGTDERVVAAIYDGTGYGTDATVWGGEILDGGLESFTRAASLMPVPMPGAAAAIRHPWRMACAWLDAAGAAVPATITAAVDGATIDAVRSVARSPAVSPQTSSAGRLFDAVAAICGIRLSISYEGQSAIELEAALGDHAGGARVYEIALIDGPAGGPSRLLDPRPLITEVVRDVTSGVPVAEIAAGFHAALARATAAALAQAAADAGVGTVVLSGGVFLNRTLLSTTSKSLEALGLRVLTPRLLPPGDGGISYGQAAVAAAQRTC